MTHSTSSGQAKLNKHDKNILYIDTTEYGKVRFMLESQNKKTSKNFAVTPQESDKILIFLEDFLQKNKIQEPSSKIQKIIVYKKKTGSFTGLRIAVAIAQALGLVWGVPVKILDKTGR